MATTTVERDLLALERTYWQALKDKDVGTVAELTDFPCIITGAQGVGQLDRSTYAAMMQQSSWDIVDFEIGDDAQVRMLADDTAIVAYAVKAHRTVEGQPVTMAAADASTWVRRDGQWRCAMHSESILGDPYGRDHPLDGERYMALETRKRDGSWVSTPVHLVVEGDRVYFRTWSKAGKAKRLRNFPEVRLAGSSGRGRVHGATLCGTARLLQGDEDRRVAASINRKYPVLQGIAVRYGHKLMRYRTQHYVVEGIKPC